jgi:putative ABC transport system substrate-binding protein
MLHLATFQGRWSAPATRTISRLLFTFIVLAWTGAAPTASADEPKGFVVAPGAAPHYLGPLGGEGNTADILATSKQTGNVWGAWHYTAEPKFGPPLHIHKREDELFYVLSGEFAFQLGDCVKIAKAGSFAYIPKNAPHTYKNIGSEPGKLFGAVTPGGFENLFMKLPGADDAKVERLAKEHAMDSVGPEINIADFSKRLAAKPEFKVSDSALRVGVLAPGCHPPSSVLDTMTNTLSELGFVEGQDLQIDWRYSEGNAARFSQLAAELVDGQVDLIVAMSTPAALAAKQATKTIPIVMVYVADPVGMGLVASLAEPGGNITGVSDMAIKLSAKRLALLKQVVPAIQRIAVLWNAADPGMVLRYKEIETAAKVLDVTLQSLEVRNPDEFEKAFAAIDKDRPDALFVIAEVLTIAHRCRILNFAKRQKIPAMYEFALFARDGGLLAYGPKLTDTFQRAAHYVAKILNGAKPEDLPVEQPMAFQLAVNMTTAKDLGINIPASILIQADQSTTGGDQKCSRAW